MTLFVVLLIAFLTLPIVALFFDSIVLFLVWCIVGATLPFALIAAIV